MTNAVRAQLTCIKSASSQPRVSCDEVEQTNAHLAVTPSVWRRLSWTGRPGSTGHRLLWPEALSVLDSAPQLLRELRSAAAPLLLVRLACIDVCRAMRVPFPLVAGVEMCVSLCALSLDLVRLLRAGVRCSGSVNCNAMTRCLAPPTATFVLPPNAQMVI